MNISEFVIGDRFITSQLPINRAILYGIVCKGIIVSGVDTSKNPAQVMFSRENLDNPEDFNLRVDANGEVNMGSWIRRPSTITEFYLVK